MDSFVTLLEVRTGVIFKYINLAVWQCLEVIYAIIWKRGGN